MCSSITRKNCAESGVPTGFPSYTTDVFLAKRDI